jgi:hypothetical protein
LLQQVEMQVILHAGSLAMQPAHRKHSDNALDATHILPHWSCVYALPTEGITTQHDPTTMKLYQFRALLVSLTLTPWVLASAQSKPTPPNPAKPNHLHIFRSPPLPLWGTHLQPCGAASTLLRP